MSLFPFSASVLPYSRVSSFVLLIKKKITPPGCRNVSRRAVLPGGVPHPPLLWSTQTWTLYGARPKFQPPPISPPCPLWHDRDVYHVYWWVNPQSTVCCFVDSHSLYIDGMCRNFHCWVVIKLSSFFVCLALNMTSASSFQMLRGAVIIFTGLLSVSFLGRRLEPSQWIGILVTILGLVVVGLADFVSGHGDDSHKLSEVITGNEC